VRAISHKQFPVDLRSAIETATSSCHFVATSRRGVRLFTRIVILAIAALFLSAGTSFGQQAVQPVQDQAIDADRDMAIGRDRLHKHDFLGAINRFKAVITHHHGNENVPEALERLTEAYLFLGIISEAQVAVAILGRNFPDSDWYRHSFDLLRSVGVEPNEDERSWISRAFK
jgi:lipopolysaccharide biosynthesis regulator YciM